MATGFRSVLALCSLLHEPAVVNSATRRLGGRAVLAHTLGRLRACGPLAGAAVLCWDDQAQAVRAAARESDELSCGAACSDGQRAAGEHATGHAMIVLPHGPRQCLPGVAAVAAAQRWADGWRGGLLQTIPQDRGFFAPSALAVTRAAGADAAMLVDPSFALLDVPLNQALLAHARQKPGHELYFMPAAPGLVGLLVSRGLLERLAESKQTPGRLLHYRPEAPQLDPVAADYCCHGPIAATRTLADFRMDSARKIAAGCGEVEAQDGPEHSFNSEHFTLPLPREITIELTTRRLTRPAWLASTRAAELSPECLQALPALLAELVGGADDLRLTLAGRGDPLLADSLATATASAREAGVQAIHVETDLLCDAADMARLAATAEVISVHLPGMSRDTYQAIMGIDACERATRNLALLIALRDRLNRGMPIIVPTFVKCRANLHEMEAWYDAWLTTAGSAVIRGPDALGNVPPADALAAVMARTERREPELRILADGTLADEFNRPLGRLGQTSLADAWAARRPVQISTKPHLRIAA